MTMANIVMVPFYVKHMGVEAYGLIGFFAMVQSWFQLLDMGLTPTMARETALFVGGATKASRLCRLLRILEWIFIGIAILGGVVVFVGSSWISAHWLKVHHLPLSEIRRSIQLMSGIIALRWVCGLYRAAITGFEHLMWLSLFNSIVTTARFFVVIPVFMLFGSGPIVFFSFQLLLAFLELLLLVIKTYSLLPSSDNDPSSALGWESVRALLRFSLGVAFVGSVWVVVTQVDKLILSKLITLGEYAYYTIAVLVASAITILGGPISSALQPRMTKLHAEGKHDDMFFVYRQATQLVGVMAGPSAVLLIFFPEKILWVWTVNPLLAQKASLVLSLYAIGNLLLIFSAFPYYLQFAMGKLKFHIIGSILFLIFLMPSIVWATRMWGSVGAGFTWLTANALYLAFWVPFVHCKFAKKFHFGWIANDVFKVIMPPIVVGIVAQHLIIWPHGRFETFIVISSTGLIMFLAAISGSSLAKASIIGIKNRLRFYL